MTLSLTLWHSVWPVWPLPMTEHRAPFIEKFLSKVSKDSCLIYFSKFILIISHNLVLIFLIMTSLVSYFFWYFSKFLAFHISFSIVIWIVRRSSLTLLSLTKAFKMRTQFVEVIFAVQLSLFRNVSVSCAYQCTHRVRTIWFLFWFCNCCSMGRGCFCCMRCRIFFG